MVLGAGTIAKKFIKVVEMEMNVDETTNRLRR